jgi:2-polyprenyl-6-methoxyphenol hydroxylase-like FAD-dependent oxidoreductase
VRSAVVVGAGVGGIATAGALARAGWSVTLLTRDERLRAGEAAVLLWPNGVRALHALGLGAGLDAISTPIPATGLRRRDGHWVIHAADAPMSGAVVVHREDLHDAFVAGLGESVEIRTGVRINTARRDGERPAVADGRSWWEADVVVAADGAQSAVRQRLWPSVTSIGAGSAAWRAVVPSFRLDQLPVLPAGEIVDDGHHFLHATFGAGTGTQASPRGGVYWTATVPGAARPEPPAAQLALLRRWFAGWPEPVAELLAATEPDNLVQEERRELRPVPDQFDRAVGTGGYVLLGDAGYAMADHLAMAPCLALEDAATLQALLRDAQPGSTVAAALGAYTRLRRPRVLRVARQSRRLGPVLQTQTRLIDRIRDATVARLGARQSGGATGRLTDWSPPTPTA